MDLVFMKADGKSQKLSPLCKKAEIIPGESKLP